MVKTIDGRGHKVYNILLYTNYKINRRFLHLCQHFCQKQRFDKIYHHLLPTVAVRVINAEGEGRMYISGQFLTGAVSVIAGQTAVRNEKPSAAAVFKLTE